MSMTEISEVSANILQMLGSPARTAILIAIGRGEACVCHLEAVLGWRQAYISQHLMALRKAGVLSDRREGRFVYYRLRDEAVLSLLRGAVALAGLDPQTLDVLVSQESFPACECPNCAPILVPVEGIEKR